ncbi:MULTISPECIES: glycosyltransferase [unclassified Mesorhizobium]|uniref:glycosyltransferase family 2 protein n=1 Tax=unclassified Mesorhizobium TaxID=325217 RepID=UPI0003CDDA8B|nr:MULTISPECIES: glycosyltransferase [unclassified Mesorhizobium]ESX43474.1 glycosyl transferase [Mesorhizobium sp. LSHC426A00]ESX48644.1 glycosyl transferase [Mesorhizobium sp. LSHC424B00]ESX73548.1 glycosyl transferase [Mesorhizobium sp. LSHC416B00]ESY24704.1 glycosyl transferase [Mesorhizobium sp. LNJC395A00]ESZ50163.1 glycosyl transferase [Mesorhizobium sp. L103C565B0]
MTDRPHPLLRDHQFASAPVPTSPRSERPSLEVSFIVCTRDRAAVLEACIASIQTACRVHATFAAELVVVDNGSRDGTSKRLAAIAETSDIPVTAVSETRPGLAAARNAGLARARGRVLVFVDDDCKLDRDYLRDLERHYRSGEKWLIRGGRVELGDARDLPFTIKLREASERLTPAVHPGGFVLGCNMTMHRDVAARIGSFDERFGAGGPLRSAEDTDYLVRAMLLGMPVEYVPDMTVLHHHGRRDRKSIDRLHRDYSLGNGALCLKHVRHAPWLLRHVYWSARAAFRELAGRPRFDRDLDLSHWPIVVMNLAGAARFALLVMMGWPKRLPLRHDREASEANAEARAR